ncbi:DUF2309 domain-containing protein [Cryobacterium psychrophilum]|uniref:Probable inorganic carbon transporter subunit DabA n=1 Tax=Cryobacterium psychrophilum TaxID=41988 RepID=A0A4Y8KNK3_9MICO|nr:DUF2309 domain-containing protein [Cryobacterium psychrophilum]TDW29999.1 hypothetical protein EDD25_1729 [Cryobacterium psychrophilum]TFD75552.1 DUF2309 domain-containing protein [Cryobacterium psychrophilum]
MNLEIRAAVARATRTVIPQWPLSSFIAVNPLGAHEFEDFDRVATTRPRKAFLADYETGRITDRDLTTAVLQRVPELTGAGNVALGNRVWTAAELVAAELVHADHHGMAPSTTTEPDIVDELVSKWIAAYLDPHPLWEMPNRHQGLWAAWTAMGCYDPHLSGTAQRRLRDLPHTADEGLAHALTMLGVHGSQTEAVLQREAQRLPGWLAHIKWRSDHVGDIDVTSYLAIRTTLRWALGLPAPDETATHLPESATVWERAASIISILSESPASPDTLAHVARILGLHPPQFHAFTWQNAYEDHYRRQLLASLSTTASGPADPRSQVVMCIDVRSEGMRRHLEADPSIETYGFAGFFGVPIRFARYQARGSIDAVPALLAARHMVTEATTDLHLARRRTSALRLRDAFAAGVHAGETVPAAPFALAETLGWFLGAGTLLRTLWPSSTHTVKRLRRHTTPTISTHVTIADAFTLDERVAFAETGIRMMGLDRFAPLIILAGHGSTSTNNLYQSALDCGACGGNPGAANARAAAAIFNDPDVRRLLAHRGLSIPDTSFFVAAEHNTMSDRIDIFDHHLIPRSHTVAVSDFLHAQTTASNLLVAERSTQLPGATGHSTARVRQRAHDWAEVYPELGLAGNSAMIIGPREMTRGVDLKRRVFLHSYRPECDLDGSALETIMTAPLVVAQWINHQYYFSTVDQNRWGAGTKTLHNAIGTIGVLSGHTGDLQSGLPLQSVAIGTTGLHELMRLSVLIQAPLDRIGTIISRNQVLRHLFDNNWITLTARNDQNSPWRRYSTYGWFPEPHLDPTTQGE